MSSPGVHRHFSTPKFDKEPEKLWHYDYSMRTVGIIAKEVPMFPLTLKGLEKAIDHLQK